MPRKGKLEITKDKQSGKWFLNISAKLSKTGKRQRRKFDTKAEAEKYQKQFATVLNSPRLKQFNEALLTTANHYNEVFQLYGFKGLDDACAAWVNALDRQSTSITLSKLIDQYEENRGADWSSGYKKTFLWAKKQVEECAEKQISQLDAPHWESWLPKWRKSGKFSAKSFNHLRTFLISIYSTAPAVSIFPTNPIKSIPSAKIRRKEITIATNKEVSDILSRAQKEDPEMVPWFAIAFFAGLRPESELSKLTWSDINFEEKWIRVGFGNKTDTKRFVDLSDNLATWLKPYAKKRGKIQQPNHRKRKEKIINGDEKKPPLITWARDITRHTYGSNLEAQARAKGNDSKSTILENMGHSMLQTFEQHYRNARTAKQASFFWSIKPRKISWQ